MATALRPIAHDDRLSLVEHLTELRSRLVVSLAAFCVATGVCLWQSHAVLNLMNRPLDRATMSSSSKDPLQQGARWDLKVKGYLLDDAALWRALAARESDSHIRALQLQLANRARQVADAAPHVVPKRPVTLGVGEPFTATLKVAAMAGLLLSLPLLLYEAYAFILPAFSPREREIALPIMLGVPFLFIAGVVFGYVMVLPPALRFLQNFNNDSFNVLIQARDYYGFSIMLLIAMGALFQIPIGLLGATRMGVITTHQLSHNRRYAILVIAVIAMVLPGQDPVTMLLMMAPMYVLYEGSILLSWLFDRRARRARRAEETTALAVSDED